MSARKTALTRYACVITQTGDPVAKNNPITQKTAYRKTFPQSLQLVEERVAAKGDCGSQAGNLNIVGSVDVGQHSVLALK